MSLDRGQRATTRLEFQANWELAALDEQTVEADLGMTADELHGILAMTPGIDPARVWLLRDRLKRRDEAGLLAETPVRPEAWATRIMGCATRGVVSARIRALTYGC